MFAKRRKQLTELSHAIGSTPPNLSILNNQKARAIKLSTLSAICKHLEYQPGDILEYMYRTRKSRPPEPVAADP